MSDSLYRLAYYSRNRVPGTPDEVAREVETILEASQRNNAKAGITGALIFNSGVFAQILEGARCDIEATFERIQRDPRHGDVQVLALTPVSGRGFPTWSMAYLGKSVEDRNLFGHIGALSGFDERRLESERLLSIMKSIAMEDETRAS